MLKRKPHYGTNIVEKWDGGESFESSNTSYLELLFLSNPWPLQEGRELRESSEEKWFLLAETLAMICRLLETLYRNEVAQMLWRICYAIVYTSALQSHANIFFTSFICRTFCGHEYITRVYKLLYITIDNQGHSKWQQLCAPLVYNTYMG